MARFRLVFIFVFLSLTLMACNLTRMISGNQEEPEVDVTPETSMDSFSEGEVDMEIDQDESMNGNQEGKTTESMDSSQGSFTNASSTACDHPYFPIRKVLPGCTLNQKSRFIIIGKCLLYRVMLRMPPL